MLAFVKKELLAQIRSGKLIGVLLIFAALGIMNPVITKLTPLLLELFSESLAETGMTITVVDVSALDSWLQFYKNIPLGIIAFVVLQSNIFTREYRSGTLVLSLTKGLERYKVVLSKAFCLVAIWTLGFWLCFGVTYVGNMLFWDNSEAKSLVFSAVCCWVGGLWTTALTVLFSIVTRSMVGVLIGTGSVTLGIYVLDIIPKAHKILPTTLYDGTSLVYGLAEVSDYTVPLIVGAAIVIACLAVSIPVFNKKQL